MSHAQRIALGNAGGVAFAAIWSGSFVATKIALVEISPLWLAGVRLTIAGLLLLVLTFPSAGRLWRHMTPKARLTVMASGFLTQAFYLAGTYWALVSLPTSTVNIIVAALPLVSVPMAYVVLGESLDLIDIWAAGLGLAGIVIVVVGRDPNTLTTANFLSSAVMLTVASVFALAAGNALVKPHVSTVTIIPTCAIQMTFSGLLVIVCAARLEGSGQLSISARSVEALAYLVLIGSIAGTFVWYKVLETFTAKGASMFFLFTPVFGLVIGSLLLGEAMTFTKLLGGSVVCGSILLRGAFTIKSLRSRVPSSG